MGRFPSQHDACHGANGFVFLWPCVFQVILKVGNFLARELQVNEGCRKLCCGNRRMWAGRWRNRVIWIKAFQALRIFVTSFE